MRICPGCRAVYDESVQVCEKDGLPLLDVSPTFAAIKANQLPDLAKRPADQTLAEGMMVGEYMIERLIAEGGMGQVFAAIHPVISKRVAVKVLGKHFATDAKAISRFVLEARSVNQIGHHNIVDIFSIGELDDGRNYLIMELLDGLPLHEVLRNVKRFNVGEILPVYEQLCDALEAAHQKSFVHRDLKPDNVIVLRRPPHPFIKILDFGIAKLRDARSETENTEVGTVLGTPEYMAPEQCRGGQIDGRVDIYALGVMLYELVTGRKPFTDPNPLRILSKQMREQPVPPSRLAPIPKALEIVILKAMAKDLEARYGTVREFYDALKAATPEILPWRASLKRPAGGMRQEQVRTIPPESLKHSMSDRAAVALPPRVRRVDVPAPVSISDAIDTTAETDDEEATLVAEPKRVPPAVASRQVSGRKRDPSAVQRPLAPPKGAGALAPMPMSRVSTGELDGVATEIGPVDHVHVDVAAKTPPPALGSVSSGELDTAVTVVEDDEPVMLVDRPVADVMGASEMVQDTAGHHISATFLPPSVVTASPVSVGQGGSPRVGRRSTSGQAETSPPPISEISTGDRTNERDLSALPAKGKKKKAGATLPL
ncbi:MAG: protein kinase, partial [Deltaproteobacteria bacterium]|nr:protein kinase [Deltaproteobacteria bacterium]